MMFGVPKYTNCIRLYERRTNMGRYGGRYERKNMPWSTKVNINKIVIILDVYKIKLKKRCSYDDNAQ